MSLTEWFFVLGVIYFIVYIVAGTVLFIAAVKLLRNMENFKKNFLQNSLAKIAALGLPTIFGVMNIFKRRRN